MTLALSSIIIITKCVKAYQFQDMYKIISIRAWVDKLFQVSLRMSNLTIGYNKEDGCNQDHSYIFENHLNQTIENEAEISIFFSEVIIKSFQCFITSQYHKIFSIDF